MMFSQDAPDTLSALEAAGVIVWLDGGWGIDALVREQTRPHDDLDLVLALHQLEAAWQALAVRGFTVVADEMPTRCVMRDDAGHKIDFHLVTLVARRLRIALSPNRIPRKRIHRWARRALPDAGDSGALPSRL